MEGIRITKKCYVCKEYIREKEEFVRLETTSGPVMEETIYVHRECNRPKLLESVGVRTCSRVY